MDLGHPDLNAADPAVREILEPFCRSAAFREIRDAEEVERELPFVVGIDGTTWSGRIDLLYRRGDRWIVVDYKTDRLEDPERYRTQAGIYARAAQLALGLPAPPEFRLLYLRSGRAVRM
jgi:ATP-dependent exoDNAse (exonuclease V) beta subunit